MFEDDLADNCWLSRREGKGEKRLHILIYSIIVKAIIKDDSDDDSSDGYNWIRSAIVLFPNSI